MAHDLVQMVSDVLAASPTPNPGKGTVDTSGLATWLRNLIGPLLLAVISVVSLFFLFTREITRFIQFLLLAVAIGVVFYFPQIIETIARGVAAALGIPGS